MSSFTEGQRERTTRITPHHKNIKHSIIEAYSRSRSCRCCRSSCFFLCVCRVGDVAHGNNHDLNADVAADHGQLGMSRMVIIMISMVILLLMMVNGDDVHKNIKHCIIHAD